MNLRSATTLVLFVASAAVVAAGEQEEFFEKNVRPVLAKRCFECHGAETQEAGLRLDSREAVLQGGQSGKIVTPGDPEGSRLIIVLRYDADVQMPPDGKLPKKDFDALVTWVRQGLPWPEDDKSRPQQSSAAAPSIDEQIAHARATHWAYQPVRKPPVPEVAGADAVASPIDRFIRARLQEEGITPSPAADRRTLLRRVTFDLTGLPPTAEEVDAFVADQSPDAWAKVIDRLLASPQYGERWGRHWLDIARYSDTRGYVLNTERRFPYAYTYRDYVVRSFNEDLPFNRFVLEQLAADQLPPREDGRYLAAMGFLTVGRRFSNVHDTIDDRIDVVTRGLLGLTVACARCHDHKYDPIPTADYYSLYGVFNSSVEPDELPLIGQPEESEEYRKFQTELAKLEGQLDDFLAKERAELLDEFRTRAGDYLAQLVAAKSDKAPQDAALSLSRGEPRPQLIRRWRDYVNGLAGKSDPVFGPWHELVGGPAERFADRVQRLIKRLQAGVDDGRPPVNSLVRAAILAQPPQEVHEVARLYEKLLVDAHNQWTTLLAEHKKAGAGDPPDRLSDPAAEQLRQVLYGPDSPVALPPAELDKLFDRATRNKARELQKKVDSFKVNSPVAPPRAMVLHDVQRPTNVRVFLRGNFRNLGPEVPRQFLAVVAGDKRKPFTQGSGRLELARAIVDPANPLTSRVIVNRVWQHHFGQGLVRTPSDFGARSEPPTHPELLDWLAATFMEQGWSLKKLHRLILLSATYQQSSQHRADAAKKDPDNRLLWRMNRRRLEFEAARDAILAAAGSLDSTVGGRPVSLTSQPYTTRRTIYGLVDRQDLPDVFRVFDFASPDTSTELRPQTTVPQQALFVMNSPFVLEQCRRLVARQEIASQSEPEGRIRALYRAILIREPEPDETKLALEFLKPRLEQSAGNAQASQRAWEMYAQVLLLTNEFMFVD